MPAADLSLGPMRRDEVATLGGWAADEGWNPGKADLDIAWDIDPDAFIALRRGAELVGGGTIFSYAGLFGFMGLFIVRKDLRGDGLGAQLWHYRLKRLQARLSPGAVIGMDGVFAMVPFYARGGFALAYRDLRFQGIANGSADPQVQLLDEASFATIDRFDRAFSDTFSGLEQVDVGDLLDPRALPEGWLEKLAEKLLSDDEKAQVQGLGSLQALMDTLRRNGPWESTQTHASLRRYLLEEVYELLDALDGDDQENLREELGDRFDERLVEEA